MVPELVDHDDGHAEAPCFMHGDLDNRFADRFDDIFVDGHGDLGECSDDPLESAADVAVDALTKEAREATRGRTLLYAKVAEDDADAAVVSRLAALGICGEAAISLIAVSAEALGDVADEVLGADHTTAAAAALQRVWLASTLPGRRQLTDLSRRLIPLTRLPPGTRATAAGRVPVAQSMADGGGVRLDAAPVLEASGRLSVLGKKSAAALTAATQVFLASSSSPKRPRKNLPPAPEKRDDFTSRPQTS